MPRLVRRCFTQIDSIYHRLPADIETVARLLKNNDRKFRTSWDCHELSAYYTAASHPRPYRPTTTASETRIASLATEAIAPLAGFDVVACKSLIRNTTAALNAGVLRRGFVYTRKDLKGWAVRFPDPASLKHLIEPLRLLVVNSAQSPSFAAIAAYVVIVTAHPFTDGNGRMSRLAFNTLMMHHFPTVSYLPLYEMFDLSQGSHVLCCREAHYHGDWSHIASLFKTMIGDLVAAAGRA